MDVNDINLDNIIQEAETLTEELHKKQNEVTQLLIRAKLHEIELVFEATRPDKDVSLENAKSARDAAAELIQRSLNSISTK